MRRSKSISDFIIPPKSRSTSSFTIALFPRPAEKSDIIRSFLKISCIYNMYSIYYLFLKHMNDILKTDGCLPLKPPKTSTKKEESLYRTHTCFTWLNSLLLLRRLQLCGFNFHTRLLVFYLLPSLFHFEL